MKQVKRVDGKVIGFGICCELEDLNVGDIYPSFEMAHAILQADDGDDDDSDYGDCEVHPLLWNGKTKKSVEFVSMAETAHDFVPLTDDQYDKLRLFRFREVGVVNIDRLDQSASFVFGGAMFTLYIRISETIDTAVLNAMNHGQGCTTEILSNADRLSLGQAYIAEVGRIQNSPNMCSVVIVQGCKRLLLRTVAMKTESSMR